ncbi:serine--tRNA ligase [Candidatus Pacearchaeota archaeon]|nr:serine--tRNA ligase [Candidatus Pacearchaeota archaeon]|tara:strand:- start:1422 stop:2708 length:1287 start_codon:yes stop_codon:yes gene_type:complete
MIDIKLIREEIKLVRDNIKRKGQDSKLKLVDELKKKDDEWRKRKYEADDLRSKRNKIREGIKEASKNKDDKAKKDLIRKNANVQNKIEKLENNNERLSDEINEIMLQIPNIISDKVPKGKGEKDNKEIKKGGKIAKLGKIKNHVELIEELGLGGFEKSGEVAGKGFYYIKDELALLNQALIRFAIDFMNKKGYGYIETPLMLNEKSIFASMDKSAIEESVYSIDGEDLNLIGTAEQPLLAMHSEDVLKESELPKKYFSYSMCFRKEIGSHGINEKGLWRTHQFNKIEQFIFCKPEDSEKLYDELFKNSEEILKLLELPYRAIEICTGDLADWKFRSADFEVYRPTTKEYGEVMSLSNCTDYQARKLDIKVIDKHGERKVLHTLNNTVLATSRIMVAILENFQQKDGSVKIPKILWKYTGFKEIKKKKT